MKVEDSGASAENAGLKLSDRSKPGITRKKVEKSSEKEGSPIVSWNYHLPNGNPLSNEKRIEFLN